MLDTVAFWIRRAMWGQRGSSVGDGSAADGAPWIHFGFERSIGLALDGGCGRA